MMSDKQQKLIRLLKGMMWFGLAAGAVMVIAGAAMTGSAGTYIIYGGVGTAVAAVIVMLTGVLLGLMEEVAPD